MTREQAIDVLAGMIGPIIGRYLAESVAERLYEVLSGLDKEATDRLLKQAAQALQHTAPLGRP